MFEGLFQPMHLLVIFAIALLVFGPKKLPELGKGLGESIRGFKEALNSGTHTTTTTSSSTPVSTTPVSTTTESKPTIPNGGSGTPS